MSKKYHHGDLKKALIEAGYRLVKEKGIDNVSLRKIAGEVGVSHAAPKHHFPDIKNLLAHIAAKGYRALNENLTKDLSLERITDYFDDTNSIFPGEYFSERADTPQSIVTLLLFGVHFIRFAFENEYLYELMTSLELSDEQQLTELDHERKSLLLMLERTIEACQQEGTIRPGDSEDLALFVWSTVHGFISLMLRKQFSAKGIQRDPKELEARLMKSMALGLITRGQEPSDK